jgi:hypothetical protein
MGIVAGNMFASESSIDEHASSTVFGEAGVSCLTGY